MDKIFFIRPLLDLLAQAGFFRKLVSVTLRVLAALVVLGSLAAFFKAGKVVFDLPASGIMGGILFQLFFISAIYAVVHILLIRAGDIENLPAADYFAISLGAVLIRMAGEVYASFQSLLAVGGGIFVWFTGKKIEVILSPVPAFFPPMGDPNFMGGIEFMLGGVLISIAVLVASYILAEILNALARSASGSKTRDPQSPHPVTEQKMKAPYRL